MRGKEEKEKNKGRGQAKARREESKQRKNGKGIFFKIIILQRYQNKKKKVKNEYKVQLMTLVSEFGCF